MQVSRLSLSASEKISLFANLSTMLTAGIPLLDAVESLLEDLKGNQKKVLENLKADLHQGKHIYASLSAYPRCFDKVTLNLLKASEEAGTLEVTLKDLQDHIQKEVEFADKVKFAMIYPVFIIIIFLGVLVAMLVFVVPRISSVFSRLNIDLPLPTKIMVFVSDLLLKQTVWFLGGFALVVVLLVVLYRTNKQLIFEIVSSWPVISQLVHDIDLTRFSRNMYLLLSSGLPLPMALDLTKDVVMKKKTSDLIARSREMVMSGKKLSEGFRSDRKTFPAMIIKLVEAGEKSGTLDKSMRDVSVYLDYQVSKSLKTFTAVMEPILLLLVGLSVGGMMVAIISPIYGLIGKVGGR